MYKKIYRNMCFLSLLTLVLSAVVSLSVFYTSFKNRVQTETEYETHLIAEFLNKNGGYEALKGIEIPFINGIVSKNNDDIFVQNFTEKVILNALGHKGTTNKTIS